MTDSILESDLFILRDAQRILLQGCGGGQDCLAGFLFGRELTSQGKTVFYANCTFSDLEEDDEIIPIHSNHKRTKKNESYLPEHDLAKFLNQTVYALRIRHFTRLAENIQRLCRLLQIDLVIAIDAGCDALLLGNELFKDTGSPLEDLNTVLALYTLDPKIPSLLICTSTTTDSVPMATFTKNKAAVGCMYQWIPTEEVDILDYKALLDSTPLESRSIPNECLLASLEGHFSTHYVNPRLKKRIDRLDDYPPVYPATKVHWFFSIKDLVLKSPLLQTLYTGPSTTVNDLNHEIYAFYKRSDDYKDNEDDEFLDEYNVRSRRETCESLPKSQSQQALQHDIELLKLKSMQGELSGLVFEDE